MWVKMIGLIFDLAVENVTYNDFGGRKISVSWLFKKDSSKKKKMSNQQNDMMNNILASVKASLNEANMMGFDSYAEQTIAFFKAVSYPVR
jgi:hypothetical protein